MRRYMKARFYSAASAISALALFALLPGAKAETVTLANQVASPNQSTATSSTIATPHSTTFFNFILSTSGSIPFEKLSPFSSNSVHYSVISAIPGGGHNGDPADFGSAVYNVPVGATTFTILWGSPDPYNQITFWSGPAGSNGVGTGSAIIISGATSYLTAATADKGYDLATFDIAGVESIELSDEGQSAFEYADITFGTTPLPPALPLFAGGLGIMSVFARRRKRNAQAVAI